MVAFTLSLVVALNTNVQGFTVGLLVGGGVGSLEGSSEYDFWSIQSHMHLYAPRIHAPQVYPAMLMHVQKAWLHSRQQSKVCLQTYFLDGGKGWRRHLNTTPGNFHSLGSCLLPGIRKRKTKQNKNNANFTPENVISIYSNDNKNFI